ncbi:MAG: hypothetical protein K2X27_26990, partial [Candidatus Obscuribacterales bacterium]|nr:hypothetical protein [Candidatus Obscuribacterales bacterium]
AKWQTQLTQNQPEQTLRVGSTPTFGITFPGFQLPEFWGRKNTLDDLWMTSENIFLNVFC